MSLVSPSVPLPTSYGVLHTSPRGLLMTSPTNSYHYLCQRRHANTMSHRITASQHDSTWCGKSSNEFVWERSIWAGQVGPKVHNRLKPTTKSGWASTKRLRPGELCMLCKKFRLRFSRIHIHVNLSVVKNVREWPKHGLWRNDMSRGLVDGWSIYNCELSEYQNGRKITTAQVIMPTYCAPNSFIILHL